MIKIKISHPQDTPHTKIIVSNVLKSKVLKIYLMPHFGIKKTLSNLI